MNLIVSEWTAGFATKTRRGHKGGEDIDFGYVGEQGKRLHGITASEDASVERMQFIFNAFKEQNAGLGAPITGNQKRFRLPTVLSRVTELRHRNHVHFQATYPRTNP